MKTFPFVLRIRTYALSLSTLCALLVAAVLAFGCTSSQPVSHRYDTSDSVSTYETRRIKLSKIRLNSSLSSPPQMHVIARGTCEGRDCKPSTFTLRFTVEETNRRPLQVASPSITLNTDNDTIQADGPQRRLTEDGILLIGTFSRFEIAREDLKSLAISEDVKGQIGGQIPFTISKREREALVTLINAPESLEQVETDAS